MAMRLEFNRTLSLRIKMLRGVQIEAKPIDCCFIEEDSKEEKELEEQDEDEQKVVQGKMAWLRAGRWAV
jgi:hypothetical protein